MIARSSWRRGGVAVAIVGAVILGWLGFGMADETSSAATASQEQILDAIKRRALRILEERHRAKQLQFYGEVSQSVGHEKNPLYAPEHKGDWFIEDGLFLLLSKRLTPTITWQGSFVGDYLGYPKLTDSSLTSSTLTPVRLLWQPGRMWRVDGGVDLGYLWFPNDGASGYREFKPNLGIRQNLWGNWFHAIRFESSLRRYIAAHARDGAGNPKHAHRRDVRPRLRYEVGTTWRDMLFKVRNEWYLNESNDQRNDFYDARDYKMTASLTKPLTTKLSLNASYAYEHKNYLSRPIDQVVPNRARHDDIGTWTLAGIYDLNRTWSISPNFTYTRNNSTESEGEYYDWTTELTVTARF